LGVNPYTKRLFKGFFKGSSAGFSPWRLLAAKKYGGKWKVFTAVIFYVVFST